MGSGVEASPEGVDGSSAAGSSPDQVAACVHAYFAGRVQGVGFRYTARALAQQHGIVGWVRNLADGRVELEAAGRRSQVLEYLDALQRTMGRYIHDRELHWSPLVGGYQGFEVRF